MALTVSRVGAPTAPHHLIMLHGIYGRGRNWQAIAKAIVAARPDYACWLVDLPHHGDSGPSTHGNTVEGCAADVGDWLDAESITPTAVLGHSFGGKVALALAARRAEATLLVWVIDSTPDVRPASGSAYDMLRVIRGLPSDFASREEAASAFVAAGYAPGVGSWMASNLERRGDRFVWRLDFGVMDELLQSFFVTDLWPVVEHPAAGHTFHFLKASESQALSDAAVERLQRAPADHVTVHRRPGGHWIHAESPGVVTELVVATLNHR
jgi:pimeloyl-ACP methyl ester carboxylesterase